MPDLINYSDYISNLNKNNSQVILFSGNTLETQENIAFKWISNILCDNKDSSCGKCTQCILLSSNNHPDLLNVNTQDDKGKIKPITIDEVKNIQTFLSLTSHCNKKKVVFIKNTNLFTYSATNALLKILEEPPSYALFVLLSENTGALLPTLRSRCVEFKLSYSTTDSDLITKIDNNQFSLLIKCLLCPSIDNIYILSNEISSKDNNFNVFINIVIKFITDLSYYLITKNILPNSLFKDHLLNIESINKILLNKLFCLFDDLMFLININGQNINYKLHFENFLFKYQNIFK